MQILGSLAAVVTVGVFLVAGIAKLRNRSETAQGFVALGVPEWLVVPVATLELVVSFLVLFEPRFGSYLALGVLFIFTGFLVRRIRSQHAEGSKRVRCNCFGGSAEVSMKSVGRNVGLMMLAVGATRTATVELNLPAIFTASVALALGSVLHHVGRLYRALGLRAGGAQ